MSVDIAVVNAASWPSASLCFAGAVMHMSTVAWLWFAGCVS
jgi:DNA polymerase/3'-5' exonuclease PolX